jgi:hypothetical protein
MNTVHGVCLCLVIEGLDHPVKAGIINDRHAAMLQAASSIDLQIQIMAAACLHSLDDCQHSDDGGARESRHQEDRRRAGIAPALNAQYQRRARVAAVWAVRGLASTSAAMPAAGHQCPAPWLVTPHGGRRLLRFEALRSRSAQRLLMKRTTPSLVQDRLRKRGGRGRTGKEKACHRTDFIPAEIIVITLGTVQASPMATQVFVLSGAVPTAFTCGPHRKLKPVPEPPASEAGPAAASWLRCWCLRHT